MEGPTMRLIDHKSAGHPSASYQMTRELSWSRMQNARMCSEYAN